MRLSAPHSPGDTPANLGSQNGTSRDYTPVIYAIAPLAGLAGLLALWWLGGNLLISNPRLSGFGGFAPGPTFAAFWKLVLSGDALSASLPSLQRILLGLSLAFIFGSILGVAIGLSSLLERALQLPFQMLRMISPLAWMPIAILVFATWEGAIVFLIFAASIWPIIFATAAGAKRIDPAWLIAGRTHGGKGFGLLRRIILPAILPDLLTGLRLALGTAWIVLVPTEYLGVTSGLGYAINDARDTLSYDTLTAIVLLIGLVGFALDFVLAAALKRSSWTPTT